MNKKIYKHEEGTIIVSSITYYDNPNNDGFHGNGISRKDKFDILWSGEYRHISQRDLAKMIPNEEYKKLFNFNGDWTYYEKFKDAILMKKGVISYNTKSYHCRDTYNDVKKYFVGDVPKDILAFYGLGISEKVKTILIYAENNGMNNSYYYDYSYPKEELKKYCETNTIFNDHSSGVQNYISQNKRLHLLPKEDYRIEKKNIPIKNIPEKLFLNSSELSQEVKEKLPKNTISLIFFKNEEDCEDIQKLIIAKKEEK